MNPPDLSLLQTEQVDPALADLDTMGVDSLARLMNEHDRQVPDAIEAVLPHLVAAIEAIVQRLAAGGRLVYLGAGTAGRLGVLDASEIPPTFGTDPQTVQGHIAGGDVALRVAVEGAEDDAPAGAQLIRDLAISASDVVVGIAASGRTPFVIAALEAAREVGALAVAVACTSPSRIGAVAEHAIEVVVGPEIVAGSTRLKAGTAQKLVLNMISTITMVRLGKTYGNLMIDVQATNAKLAERATGIVARIAGVSRSAASAALAHSDGRIKTAVLVASRGLSVPDADRLLTHHDGRLRAALEHSTSNGGPP